MKIENVFIAPCVDQERVGAALEGVGSEMGRCRAGEWRPDETLAFPAKVAAMLSFACRFQAAIIV